MARFEVSLVGGDTLIIEHEAQELVALLPLFSENEFLFLTEVRVGASPPRRDVLLGARHVRMVRPIADGGQGSSFRPKR